MTCRLCGHPLKLIMDLGEQPPSNALLTRPRAFEQYYPLELARCAMCTLVQLVHTVPPKRIFNEGYPLHSSKGSRAWLDHAEGLCGYTWSRFALNSQSMVIEIGSNDGYLLRNYLGACQVIGVDPTGISSDVPTVSAEFNAALALTLPKADVVFALNTVAQIPDLNDFLKGLQIVLKPDGVAIFEFPDLVTTINETQFDTIYHEHYSYLSVTALNGALHRVGMRIFDVEHLKTHGGSLRVFIKHWNAEVGSESASVGDQIDAELALDYTAFTQRADKVRREFNHFTVTAHFTGKTIYGYGAAARGNTFLNYCLPYALNGPIVAIGEVSAAKVGMYTPGLKIPIISEAGLLAAKPDYVLILAWTWRHEAAKRLRELGYEGKFVTALPTLEVWS